MCVILCRYAAQLLIYYFLDHDLYIFRWIVWPGWWVMPTGERFISIAGSISCHICYFWLWNLFMKWLEDSKYLCSSATRCPPCHLHTWQKNRQEGQRDVDRQLFYNNSSRKEASYPDGTHQDDVSLSLNLYASGWFIFITQSHLCYVGPWQRNAWWWLASHSRAHFSMW